MRFRIPVRTVEAWLLADSVGISSYFRVSRGLLPRDPEALERPKRAIVDIARRSRSPKIKDDMVPEPGTQREAGLGYTGRIIAFVTNVWDPERAAALSDSLRRCMEALQGLPA